MILKDLTFALRNLRRNKVLATINVLGLSIGISSCLVIFLIVNYEMSFDRFQPDRDRIFRLYSTFSGLSTGSNSGVPTAFSVAMREQFTGIEALTNFHTFGAHVEVPDVNGNRKKLGSHSRIVIADPEYFDVFSYHQWVAGNPEEALSEPFRVVISESRARTYFGDIDPQAAIGRAIHYQDSLIVTVSGVVKDVQERTDFDFTDYISVSTIESSWLKENIKLNSWQNTSSSCQLFFKLSPGTPETKIEAQLPKLAAAYKAHNKDANWSVEPRIQPLADLHFNSELRIFNHSRSVVEKSMLQLLLAVAALLLVIAAINFINLETAQGSRRAKEVGVRKLLGSSRRKLIRRFLSESFILCIFAALLSVVLAEVSFQYFSAFMPEGFEYEFTDPLILLFLISCVVVLTFLAGLYPAFVLSSYQPALALKNLTHSNRTASRSAFIRKGLTIFQFSFSQLLIIGTIVIVGQVEFMLDKDLGFNPDAVVYVPLPRDVQEERQMAFQNELQQHSEIKAMTLHGDPPLTGGYASGIITFHNGKDEMSHNVHMKHGDSSYLDVYGIELLAGRNFLPVDSAHELLINESFMKALGFDEPWEAIGKTVGEVATIVGVVRDFHGQPLRAEIKPTIISYRQGRNLGIKLITPNNKVTDLAGSITKIENSWKKIFPEDEFNYFFVDDRIQQYYENEKRMGTLAELSTGIAILISCLGLFGLSSFTVIQRTKEIGIRKVLGATVNSILYLLSKNFLLLVIIALVLSAPAAYYITDLWLQKFAYKFDLSVWIFLASAASSIIVALITISFRTVKAAKADPVKSLRYE
jgi:putative ABC transport system permease protein